MSGQKSHVEHAVGLVEHEHLDAGQVDDAALAQVVQAARRGDEDVDAAAQLLDLGTVLGAAGHGEHEVLGLAGDGQAGAADLLCELARRAHDEHTRALALLVVAELAQRGQEERGGLAGARRRGGADVMTCEKLRDSLLLDGRRGREPHLLDGLEHRRGQTEFGERNRHV